MYDRWVHKAYNDIINNTLASIGLSCRICRVQLSVLLCHVTGWIVCCDGLVCCDEGGSQWRWMKWMMWIIFLHRFSSLCLCLIPESLIILLSLFLSLFYIIILREFENFSMTLLIVKLKDKCPKTLFHFFYCASLCMKCKAMQFQ